MNINITTLYKMQFQLLKPLSPRQEYALVVLLCDNVQEGDVAALAEVIVRDYPHVARLYDAFAAANQYENAVPFIVPVLNSEEVTEEIFCIRNHALVVAPDLRDSLYQALTRVVMMRETPDELLMREGAELILVNDALPFLLGQFVDSMLDAYNCGVLPVVIRPTKDSRICVMIACCRLRCCVTTICSLEVWTSPKLYSRARKQKQLLPSLSLVCVASSLCMASMQ